jgi:glutamate dehydrogenase/leucine dehydrogenase
LTAAELLHARGARIVAISDVHGAIHDPNGIDIVALKQWMTKHRYVKDFPGTRPITQEALLTCKCDVLIPAALENQITADIARRVRARIVAEGANGPTVPDADVVLARRKVFVIPDILCNAGGVTVSYFEWVQNRIGYFWTEDEVNERLQRIMTQAFADVLAMSLEHKTTMRIAAFMLAIHRVTEVILLRGVYA